MTPPTPPVERVLVIVAHPDDIEFGMAGTIASWTDAGIAVTFCLVTDGAAGSNDPKTIREELIETRRREQTEAAAIMGVTDVRFLGYADGTLQPTLELRRDLTRMIREVKPQRVVLMDPTTILVQGPFPFDYINHPDHRASGEAALYAVFPSAETRPIFPELLADGFEPHHVNEVWMTIALQNNHYVDIASTYERKRAALLCHKSQLDESSIGFVDEFDKEAGKQIGVERAEAFRVMRFYAAPPTELEPAPENSTETTT